jgi:predicted GH43/DUF377 family glycosyl hydrolase
MLQCGQLWQNAESLQNDKCVWNTTKVCIVTTVKGSNWCLSCCTHMWIQRHKIQGNITEVMTAHVAWILSWSAWKFHGHLLQTMDFKWEHVVAVGWGTMLQAGRSWVQFTMRSLHFLIDLILPVALWPWRCLSL